MNEQKKTALGIAILVVTVTLLVGILVFPRCGPFSHGIWGHHTYLLSHFQYRVDIITLWLVWQEL
jgi:hypothetical protein